VEFHVTPDPLDALAFYSETTDWLVDWEKLRTTLAKVDSLTERERCTLLLRAVNGDRLSRGDWSNLLGAVPNAGHPSRLVEEMAAPLRSALLEVVGDPTKAHAIVGRGAANIRNGNVVVVPEVAVDGRSSQVRERVVARSYGEALIYALWLFLDPEENYGKELRVCGRADCNRFGFAPPRLTRGQPPTYFCGDDHREEQRRIDALRRVHKSRGKRVSTSRKHK
jgi:hypothetical protein